jgi:uncharacterized protein YijF (DUF1287 family)
MTNALKFSMFGFLVLTPLPALGQIYALSGANLRAQPAENATVVDKLDANQDLRVLDTRDAWLRVRAGIDVEGWLPATAISDTWIKVWKRERKLLLMKGEKVERDYRIALGSQHPEGDKLRLKDGRTPEGRFFIAELDDAPEEGRYGARSMRLSYPSAADARRGLAERLIDKNTYLAIMRAVRNGETPPQHTALGGSIRIHGGGSTRDWTLGCVALADQDVRDLFALARKGMRVDIYASAADDARLSAPDFLPRAILTAAHEQLAAPARYTVAAVKASTLAFPGGDIAADQAVCTDIVVRALRGAGLDLQALVFEDRTLHPGHYRNPREIPRPSIDHRRVGNLVSFLRHFATDGKMSPGQGFAPGDVVVFDTGIANGTRFDHIGIVDDTKDSDGEWRAINIWTVNARTAAMDLIGKPYPTVVAWFRLGHPYVGR